jgi:calcium-dependent protein kinase
MGACYSAGGETVMTIEPSRTDQPLDRRTSERPTVHKESSLQPSLFVLDRPGKVADSYALDQKKLGEGSYGSVCRGTHKTTKAVRAIKTVPKEKLRNLDRIKREISIMKTIDHPGIVKLFETFEDKRGIHLCMELCTGGELFERIVKEGRFSEPSAATVMQQVLRAVHYLHKHGVCHRDLKPENFLLQTKDAIKDNVVKIIDFGLSSRFVEGKPMKTRAGSPIYVAPEVLGGSYDHKCDLWSTGVIMYILLCGYPPFQGNSDIEVLQKVTTGKVEFRHQDWKNVSEDARNLIVKLMRRSPAERSSAEEALRHPWIDQKAPRAPASTLEQAMVERLSAFRQRNKFMKAALHAIASQLDGRQIRGLRNVFVSLDANGDGLLAAGELRKGLNQAGIVLGGPDIEDIVDGVDVDGNGEINYSEFLAATMAKSHYMQEDVCWRAFNLFDLDRDGKITSKELKNFLYKTSTQSAAELVSSADSNGDGSVDFQEFMTMLRETGGDRLASAP